MHTPENQKDGSNAVKFSAGDLISMNVIASSSGLNDVTYANSTLFKSRFLKKEGATASVCLKRQSMPRVACLYVLEISSIMLFMDPYLGLQENNAALPSSFFPQ
ncbi:hypothetical protein CRYUN_Cryun31cG0055100 [Craigia yunnanensis]